MNAIAIPPLFLAILCTSAFLLCFSKAPLFYGLFGVYGWPMKVFYLYGAVLMFALWHRGKNLPAESKEDQSK